MRALSGNTNVVVHQSDCPRVELELGVFAALLE